MLSVSNNELFEIQIFCLLYKYIIKGTIYTVFKCVCVYVLRMCVVFSGSIRVYASDKSSFSFSESNHLIHFTNKNRLIIDLFFPVLLN